MVERKNSRDRTSYLLALQEVVATFDELTVGPVANRETREWTLESDAARMLGISKKALEGRRARGTGPTHHRRMGLIAYYLDDLDAWVASKPKGYRPPVSD